MTSAGENEGSASVMMQFYFGWKIDDPSPEVYGFARG